MLSKMYTESIYSYISAYVHVHFRHFKFVEFPLGTLGTQIIKTSALNANKADAKWNINSAMKCSK